MEKLDARAVEFASPVQDELIQSLCGVYNKVGKWNGKSYYEKAPTPDDVEGQPSFAMWFTMAPILAGEDELVAGYSWLVTPKDDIAMVWASVWQGEEDESLCPPAEGWGAAGDDSTWLASVHACVPASTEPTVEKKDKAAKGETVPRGSVAAEVAASSTEPTVEKDKTKKAKVPVKAKVQKDKTKKANAIRVVESEASSRVDGQTWKTFILRQGKTCLAHVSARKIGEVAAQSLVKMLKEKAENGEDKVAITHFKEIQMLRMKGL